MRERDKNGHLKAGVRLPGWDYRRPWIYMITLTVRGRRPVLGRIAGGHLLASPLGEKIAAAWRDLGRAFPEVEPCQYAVMPKHFHGIVWVHRPLAVPLGEVIRSFKIACTKVNAALPQPVLFDGSPTFWFPGLYDTILFSKGQLGHMTRYILRNAERRWAVMQNPDLFKTTRGLDLRALVAANSGAPPTIGSGRAPPPSPPLPPCPRAATPSATIFCWTTPTNCSSRSRAAPPPPKSTRARTRPCCTVHAAA